MIISKVYPWSILYSKSSSDRIAFTRSLESKVGPDSILILRKVNTWFYSNTDWKKVYRCSKSTSHSMRTGNSEKVGCPLASV